MLIEERVAKLGELHLETGGHRSFDHGVCAMEAVAWIAGEPHSDHPECACPVLSSFMRSWNDALADEERDRLLRPYLVRLVGTRATPQVEEQRSMLALDWLIRVYTPEWLDLRDELKVHASTLRGFSPILTHADAVAVGDRVRAARSAAESAAWSAAESAAESAAWSAAWSAARSAAWSAARSAAESAARSAARSAAWSAAGSAAWSAAGSALRPTKQKLQQSALDLLERMLAIGGAQ